jgi:hypothetical protein
VLFSRGAEGGGFVSGLSFGSATFKPVVAAKGRNIPVVSSRLSFRDALGAWAVRWGFGRNSYRVEPGLYACGSPTPESPVLVTANYKLSFDALRKELSGTAAWILVLDTRGVNVWCAAGKGTFGTAELVRRTAAVGLAGVVSHRILVLPQLGAAGVAAHEVARDSGFRVVYGPVRASDLPEFLAAGMRKDDAMRRIRFGLADRLAVAPVELAHAWPALAAALAAAGLLSFRTGEWSAAAFAAAAFLFVSPVLIGTLAFPALLPFLPFKAFALKGAVFGIAWSLAAAAAVGLEAGWTLPYALLAGSAVSFLAMNFTGSSTYTNLSGARLEVTAGLPAMAAAAAAGLIVAAVRFFSGAA